MHVQNVHINIVQNVDNISGRTVNTRVSYFWTNYTVDSSVIVSNPMYEYTRYWDLYLLISFKKLLI